MVVVLGFFIKKAFESKYIDRAPNFSSFENHTISLSFHGRSLILDALYRLLASSVQVFLEYFLSYIGFLSFLSSSFVVCGNFNIHVDSASSLVSEFKSVIDACCLTQYIEFPSHLHGYTLDPTKFSAISEVHGSCFISDHKIISFLFYFPSVANHHDKVVTFRQYHKINVDRLKEDLATSAFVANPSDETDTLHEQYVFSRIS